MASYPGQICLPGLCRVQLLSGGGLKSFRKCRAVLQHQTARGERESNSSSPHPILCRSNIGIQRKLKNPDPVRVFYLAAATIPFLGNFPTTFTSVPTSIYLYKIATSFSRILMHPCELVFLPKLLCQYAV